MEFLPYFIATGILSGLLAGLFGVGGGLTTVPILALILSAQGFPEAHVMQVAIGTSLAVIALTALSSARAHHGHRAVAWKTVGALVPGLALGALLGAWTAHGLSTVVLARIVGVGALAVALKMLLQADPRVRYQAPGRGLLTAAGTGIGWASALIGIGGGSLTVPFLRLCGYEMRQAVGTSAAAGIPIAWAGAAGFIWTGWQVQGLPAGQLGYISLPGFAAVAAASVLMAPVGARLAHRLPQIWLQRAFAALLIVIGCTMLLGIR
ncbi:sulfite exporter TauE/SafE family protein [Algiphilus sp.]|uniref:sulfite exporter TauE/SafE family protein n=1 Tax=Algiphilus sp. TaxID=1872431 RepID=UPI0032EDD25C